MRPVSLYVHLPFCPYICPYCDFAKWPYTATSARRYLEALRSELQHTAELPALADARFQTVFLGGGTPNTYGAADVCALIDELAARLAGPPGRETTIEVNPELVKREDLHHYRNSGVTRLSVGVQSFVVQEIATLGRRHTRDDVQSVVRQARGAGIASISLDLIFGVPGQTAQSWHHSLTQAIELDVDHISAYGLTVEAGTPYERWREREPAAFADDAHEAQLYEIAIETLTCAGYEHYEISNFARPGHRSEHNANYWLNGEYVGLGVGAASYVDGVRSVHTREYNRYIDAVMSNRPIPGEREKLEGVKQAGEAAMLALRTVQGVCLQGFKERYDVDFLNFYAPVVQRYVEVGLLEVSTTHARLTRRGRFLANDVCADFVTFG